jgi:hypothetical protein
VVWWGSDGESDGDGDGNSDGDDDAVVWCGSARPKARATRGISTQDRSEQPPCTLTPPSVNSLCTSHVNASGSIDWSLLFSQSACEVHAQCSSQHNRSKRAVCSLALFPVLEILPDSPWSVWAHKRRGRTRSIGPVCVRVRVCVCVCVCVFVCVLAYPLPATDPARTPP